MHMTTAESTQLHQRPADDEQLRLPGCCIENPNLRDLVLAAVRRIDPRLIPVPAAGAGIACQPRVLLGLLTYIVMPRVFSVPRRSRLACGRTRSSSCFAAMNFPTGISFVASADTTAR